MNAGRLSASGTTRDLLADDDIMRANRLELPVGFTLAPPPHEAAHGTSPASRGLPIGTN